MHPASGAPRCVASDLHSWDPLPGHSESALSAVGPQWEKGWRVCGISRHWRKKSWGPAWPPGEVPHERSLSISGGLAGEEEGRSVTNKGDSTCRGLEAACVGLPGPEVSFQV